ncbi:hypothetical protein [Methyloceanibacter sp.]|uniref:hypothetical protein n=1 Tax=Methyloceanibacter sp. TaxID=1965321 RepID=UPI002D534368|nr:hypothetical protein [Methyloceanibacter sp.]HZP07906.1 hypothetical protein [Methyloceanibacter sp.]
MKIERVSLAAIAILVALTVATPLAEAGQHKACRHGAKCYKAPRYVRPYAAEGWLNFRFFGDFSGPCAPLLRDAIEIDTPDPRYWNAYEHCIGM